MIELSKDEARYAALSSGLGFLGLPAAKPKTKTAALAASADVFNRSSWVQVDTISVVERAHHHIMWSRNPGYENSQLSKLESADDPSKRRIVEYWSHAAAYIPVHDIRYSIPRMERIRKQGHDWFEVKKDLVDEVLTKVREGEASQSRDFQADKKHPGGWWEWKPAKQALEYLFHCGVILPKTRRGFQKVFDLAERVVPGFGNMSRPDDTEMACWYVDRAERELGIFHSRDVSYLRRDGVSEIENELKRRVVQGRLHPVKFEGAEGKWYASDAALNRYRQPIKAGLKILSPFDPYVINRRRLKQLYGFEFVIECYVPEHKRVFGYFALPLLWLDGEGRSALVGKIDAKAERSKSVLRVNRVAWETTVPQSRSREGIPSVKTLEEQLAKTLKAFAEFNGAEKIEFAGSPAARR